jgi:hypothetical protein
VKIDWTFPKQVCVALLVVSVLASYPLAVYGTREVIRAVILGAFLSTLNVLLGYATIELSFAKSVTTFLKVVLGGMGIRLVLLLGTIVVLIKFFDTHVGGLVTSLGFFYIVYLTLEILYIQKKVEQQHQ